MAQARDLISRVVMQRNGLNVVLASGGNLLPTLGPDAKHDGRGGRTLPLMSRSIVSRHGNPDLMPMQWDGPWMETPKDRPTPPSGGESEFPRLRLEDGPRQAGGSSDAPEHSLIGVEEAGIGHDLADPPGLTHQVGRTAGLLQDASHSGIVDRHDMSQTGQHADFHDPGQQLARHPVQPVGRPLRRKREIDREATAFPYPRAFYDQTVNGGVKPGHWAAQNPASTAGTQASAGRA